jgi:hypothetical protein
MYKVFFLHTTAYNIWATTGTSANDPRSKLVNNQPVILKAYPGNNMYTIQDLSKTLGEGNIYYIAICARGDNVTNVTKVVNYFDVIEVNSSGKVTSILAHLHILKNLNGKRNRDKLL